MVFPLPLHKKQFDFDSVMVHDFYLVRNRIIFLSILFQGANSTMHWNINSIIKKIAGLWRNLSLKKFSLRKFKTSIFGRVFWRLSEDCLLVAFRSQWRFKKFNPKLSSQTKTIIFHKTHLNTLLYFETTKSQI